MSTEIHPLKIYQVMADIIGRRHGVEIIAKPPKEDAREAKQNEMVAV